MLRNYEVPDHFYPIGDVAQIESLQLELNETRNQILNYRKKFRRAWVYAKDLFDRQGVQALESDEDNVMVPVMGDGDPSRAIAPVPAVITPSEFFDQSAMISNDLDRVSGISDYQRGAQTAIKRTATEAAMIQDAANARAQDRLAKVEGILAECGERIVQLMQQFVTSEQVARIVTMPVRGWVNFGPQHLAGRFDFEVIGGSTEPQNETFRRQSRHADRRRLHPVHGGRSRQHARPLPATVAQRVRYPRRRTLRAAAGAAARPTGNAARRTDAPRHGTAGPSDGTHPGDVRRNAGRSPAGSTPN